MHINEGSPTDAPESTNTVPEFDATAMKTKLAELAALTEVRAAGATAVPAVLYGAYVIAARLCWAALDEVARLQARIDSARRANG